MPVELFNANASIFFVIGFEVTILNRKNLQKIIWLKENILNTKNSHAVICFQVFLSNTKNFQSDLFDPEIEI